MNFDTSEAKSELIPYPSTIIPTYQSFKWNLHSRQYTNENLSSINLMTAQEELDEFIKLENFARDSDDMTVEDRLLREGREYE